MKKMGQFALATALAAGLSACGQETASNTTPTAENVAAHENPPANMVGNGVTEPAASNVTAPAADASPPREKARPAPPAPRPKAEPPRPAPPPADPHAGHDMANMTH